MEFVRLTAVLIRQHSFEHDPEVGHTAEAPGDPEDYKGVLVCALDDDRDLVRGEWMGYLTFGEQVRPFVLHGKQVVFGSGPQGRWECNLGDVTVQTGAVFSLGDFHSRTVWTYEIRSLFSYGHLHG